MVKIRVHSRDDIIKAYLRGLGYGVDIDISKLLASYESLNQQDDISKSFDDIIYNKAKKVFSKDLSKMQSVSLYKALFIEGKNAEKYGIDALLPDFDKSDEYFKKSAFFIVPHYKASVIPTQKIEPFTLHK